jgi:hypothetical protein
MLEHLPDQEMVASVAGDATSTNLDEVVNRSVKELDAHDSWHVCRILRRLSESQRLSNAYYKSQPKRNITNPSEPLILYELISKQI